MQRININLSIKIKFALFFAAASNGAKVMKDVESVGEAGRGQRETLTSLHKESVARQWIEEGEGTRGRPVSYQSRRLVHNQIAAIVTNAIKSGASCEQQPREGKGRRVATERGRGSAGM